MSEKFNSIIAGSFSGISEAIITWPIENIKTQMQFFDKKNNFRDTTKNIYKIQGLKGFYKGLFPVLLLNIPKAAIRFYSYEFMNEKLYHYDRNKRIILSGLYAGFIESTFITVPSETIKTKMIKNPSLSFWDIVKKEKIYLGYIPTLMRQSLNQSSRFFFYENYKELFPKKNNSSFYSFIGGVGAGCFSVIISSPADLLKTQLQEGTNKSIFFLIRNVYNNNGIFGFWRGSLARFLRVAPGQGIMFLTYEYVTNLLKK